MSSGLVGYGQIMTVKQQNEFNAKAKWVAVAENLDKEPFYVDSSDITRLEELVIFRAKMTRELAGNTYSTIIGNCITANFIFTNVFVELPDKSLLRQNMTSSPVKAERKSLMYYALVYACNFKDAEVASNT